MGEPQALKIKLEPQLLLWIRNVKFHLIRRVVSEMKHNSNRRTEALILLWLGANNTRNASKWRKPQDEEYCLLGCAEASSRANKHGSTRLHGVTSQMILFSIFIAMGTSAPTRPQHFTLCSHKSNSSVEAIWRPVRETQKEKWSCGSPHTKGMQTVNGRRFLTVSSKSHFRWAMAFLRVLTTAGQPNNPMINVYVYLQDPNEAFSGGLSWWRWRGQRQSTKWHQIPLVVSAMLHFS
jgi:hypothetical protein